MSLRQAKILGEVKASFLLLCAQYERMGHLLRLTVESSVEKGLDVEHLKSPLAQLHEMGEQMKQLGKGIDLLGGKRVM